MISKGNINVAPWAGVQSPDPRANSTRVLLCSSETLFTVVGPLIRCLLFACNKFTKALLYRAHCSRCIQIGAYYRHVPHAGLACTRERHTQLIAYVVQGAENRGRSLVGPYGGSHGPYCFWPPSGMWRTYERKQT